MVGISIRGVGRVALLLAIGLTSGPAFAGKPPGGHGGGRPHPPAAPRHAYRPPRMPRPAPARPKANHPRPAANHAANHKNAANHPAAAVRTHPATRPGVASRPAQGRYAYGSGYGVRPYRAYGYGRGYRNRYYGAGYGYGRSQGLYRGIVARLRSVHASLARDDHDYQGHRVRAMREVSLAIRQLSHGYYGGSSYARFAPGMSGPIPGIARQTGARRSNLANGRQPMSQAQSDARMTQALRNLQGIESQLVNQGYGTLGGSNASGHIRRAIRELEVALSIR